MKQDGFSLIELLIVVAIIGIIASIAVPRLIKARAAAYEASAVAYLKTWVPGQEMYKRVHGYYSSTDEDLVIERFINKGLNTSSNADDVGYNYDIASESTNSDGTPNTTEWWGTARRKSALIVTNSYFIDQTGVIRIRTGSTAGVGDPPFQ